MLRFVCVISCHLFWNLTAQVPVIGWSITENIPAAEAGYTNLRMELDPNGHPIILHGKSGSNGGLFCTRWNGTGFDTAVPVTGESGLFINDAEGPRLAVQGLRVAVGYQISGQWDTGARVVISEDGGTTWGAPIPVAPNATEDHFMPTPAFDAEGNPWVALKWGNAPALEGIMNWDVDAGAFSPAVDGGGAIPGDAVCECCASMPFMLEGRPYNLVRNNNANIRDFHLTRADDAGNWTESLDVDATDWNINSCPASEAEVAILGDGRIAAVYMSAAEGGARTYWSTIDPEGWVLLGTDRIEPGLDFTENNPSVDADGDHAVAAWERSDGGYQIVTAVGSNDAAGMDQWATQSASVTEGLSGHSRRPVIRIQGNTVHLVFQRPSDNAIQYRQGTILSSTVQAPALPDWNCAPTVNGWRIRGTQAPFHWRMCDTAGRPLSSGLSTNQQVEAPLSGFGLLEVCSGQDRMVFKVVR